MEYGIRASIDNRTNELDQLFFVDIESGVMDTVDGSFSLITLFVGEVSRSQSLSYNRMISVADGDPPLPPFPGSSGSVSVSRSTSKSGFVHIIRFLFGTSFTTARWLAEENVERVRDGWLVKVAVVGPILVIGRYGGGSEKAEKEEGVIGGETRMVFRRAIRIGEGFRVRLGGK